MKKTITSIFLTLALATLVWTGAAYAVPGDILTPQEVYEEILAIKSRLDDHESRLNTQGSQLKTNTNNIQENFDDIESLTQTVTDLQSRIEELENSEHLCSEQSASLSYNLDSDFNIETGNTTYSINIQDLHSEVVNAENSLNSLAQDSYTLDVVSTNSQIIGSIIANFNTKRCHGYESRPKYEYEIVLLEDPTPTLIEDEITQKTNEGWSHFSTEQIEDAINEGTADEEQISLALIVFEREL